MRYLLAPLLLIVAIIVVYKIFKSKKVDSFLDRLLNRPAPESADALTQELSRIEKDKETTERVIAERKAQLESEHERLSKLKK